MDLGLKDKSVLVTASSKGIGRAIALSFAVEGARVAINARGDAVLRKTLEDLTDLGCEALAIQGDLSSPDESRRLIEETVGTFGRIDVLVNNAGTAIEGHALEDTDEAWLSTLEKNLLSAVRCCRLALPYMRTPSGMDILGRPQKGGCIVNVAGVGSFREELDFNCARSALIAFTKSLAHELAAHDIRVNTINPGLVRTPLGERLADRSIPTLGKKIREVFERAEAPFILPRRFGKPEEIADVVVFLSSPRAGFVSGACWNVDGAMSRLA